MRAFIFYVLLFILVTVLGYGAFAQKVSSEKGLTTATFNTPQGIVTVYLPDDMRAGETISGTVEVTPGGKNERQVQRNMTELLKLFLSFNNEKFKVDKAVTQFKFLVNTDTRLTGTMALQNANGVSILDCIIPPKPVSEQKPPSLQCVIPSHVLTGSPMTIQGPFDGNAANTTCAIGNQPVTILAESPRGCVVSFPQNATGPQTTQINESGQEPCSKQVSGVDMQITTGKLNLLKGETTYLDIKITGLSSLPDKAKLTITNLTPSVVNITNGNNQVIPIWPSPDSANGTFSIHCPAVSLATGNFSVNVNLDLPQPGQTQTPASEVPPGYKKLSCDCGATATISKTGNNFKVEAKPACKGQYGVGINTFPVCSVLSVAYYWSIASGNANVELTGKTDQTGVGIKPKNSSPFSVCAKVTVTCIDGTVCVTTVCADQAGNTVSNPDKSTNPPETKAPPVTGEPTRPPTTTTGGCKCSASCQIIANSTKNNEVTYSAVVNAECKGMMGGGNTGVPCSVGHITYAWSIGASGKDVAEIVGKADEISVKVKLKKEGQYTLYLSGLVTCSDGSTCEFVCNVEIPLIPTTTIPKPKACGPEIEEKVEPKMDGGLKLKQIGLTNSAYMNRDEYIALEAEGGDWDQLVFRCDPKKPDCPDSKSEKTVPLIGRVKFEWKIDEDGKGTFVQLGCLTDAKSTEGDRVIFKPPYIPLPVKGNDTTVIATITLSIIDDGSAVDDGKVDKKVTIKMKRTKTSPDKYQVEITSDAYKLPAAPVAKAVDGTCKTVGPTWTPKSDLIKPAVILPPVPDNNKMVLGQWIVLTTSNQYDNDLATFTCVSTGNCATGPLEKSYPDKVDYDWEIVSGKGKFVVGKTGRYVIYEAPLEMPRGVDVIDVKFRVTAKNPGGDRKDPDMMQEEMLIKVYQPGVMLSHPPLDWLPTEDNSIEITSTLKYREAAQWKPALAHMCRIHFFELLNVSEEKGVCLNNPVLKDAKVCRDYKIEKTGDHEAFDSSGADKCKGEGMFKQARTKSPEKEYTIKINSLDFGGYGFLRSFANVNKGGKDSIRGEEPVYIPIPAHEAHKLAHPQGRPKKNKYTDNRVTLPYDIDENRIADNGWTAVGGAKVADPAYNKLDDDDTPIGDAFKGDGFTNYEEYRGFKVSTKAGIVHQRTNTKVKDIFIRNESDLLIGLYDDISGLDAHEITEDQYISDEKRLVNFNFNKSTHLDFEQMGLHLIDNGSHAGLLGIAYSRTGEPTIPNAEIEIRIYTTKVRALVDRLNKGVDDKDQLNYNAKLNAVVSHELLHGNNVCHHGEGDPEQEGSHNNVNGLRSGNVDCVMRYDNAGTAVLKIPEKTGTSLCTSTAGTGYNANGQRFKDAAAKRGNCAGQIRVSGAGKFPKSCGNR